MLILRRLLFFICFSAFAWYCGFMMRPRGLDPSPCPDGRFPFQALPFPQVEEKSLKSEPNRFACTPWGQVPWSAHLSTLSCCLIQQFQQRNMSVLRSQAYARKGCTVIVGVRLSGQERSTDCALRRLGLRGKSVSSMRECLGALVAVKRELSGVDPCRTQIITVCPFRAYAVR